MNALKHGLRAANHLLPDDDKVAFQRLHEAYQRDFPAGSTSEVTLVYDLAVNQWQYNRARLILTAIQSACQTIDDLNKYAGLIDILQKGENRYQRAFARNYLELRRRNAWRYKHRIDTTAGNYAACVKRLQESFTAAYSPFTETKDITELGRMALQMLENPPLYEPKSPESPREN